MKYVGDKISESNLVTGIILHSIAENRCFVMVFLMLAVHFPNGAKWSACTQVCNYIQEYYVDKQEIIASPVF